MKLVDCMHPRVSALLSLTMAEIGYEASDGAPRTMYDKIWTDHVVTEADDGTCTLFIDRHLVHEVGFIHDEAYALQFNTVLAITMQPRGDVAPGL